MGKIGFNCQLLLSEIGLTTDSSHSTWGFIKPYDFPDLNKAENTNRIEIETVFSVYFPRFRCYRGLYAIDRIISDHIDIPSTQHRSSKGSRRPTKARKPGSFRKWIPIRRVHNRMDKLTLTRQFGIQFGIFLGKVSGRNWNGIISIHTDTEERVLY
ncbi:hypothetical protein O6P43_035136 [Quillaja saponaria]|uniref:Uncharacterized protein n=1 Tax=Quillaja saponaria TaxID=32244 RepID=A0AAD7KL53_QUISA|nr:hypothetical protein O6P43_035136 [Quillaja saponaria]